MTFWSFVHFKARKSQLYFLCKMVLRFHRGILAQRPLNTVHAANVLFLFSELPVKGKILLSKALYTCH